MVAIAQLRPRISPWKASLKGFHIVVSSEAKRVPNPWGLHSKLAFESTQW